MSQKNDRNALRFEVKAKCGMARYAKMQLPHFTAQTPMFMPVGTQGTVKGLTTKQMEQIGCQVILGNTYHLENRPGSELVAQMGGLHNFISWNRGMLTDSGGFQMVSLLKFAEITEEGVNFESPRDGSMMLLTPEQSMQIQNNLGADIIMQLDDVVPSTSQDPERFKEATLRTTRWLDRCIVAHKNTQTQNLFAIIQGGTDLEQREISLKQLIQRDTPGYAIGGLVGGEDKYTFCKIIHFCAQRLPENKPRYVMGVGYPIDILICSALGCDMYDSVFPTRTARFGTALLPSGELKLKQSKYKKDTRPIDADCSCMVCKTYSRSFISNLLTKDVPLGGIYLSYHNISYMMTFCEQIRQAIRDDTLEKYCQSFLDKIYTNKELPDWIIKGFKLANIDVRSNFQPNPTQSPTNQGCQE